MAKVRIKASKESVEKAEDQGDFVQAPKGIYTAELTEVNPGHTKGKDGKPDKTRPYLECVWKIDGKGREAEPLDERYSSIWDYVTFSDESDWKRAQFGTAVGLPVKNGEIDGDIEIEAGKPGTVIGARALVRIKGDKDQDGDYKAKIGWMGPLSGPALPDNPMAGGDDEPEAADDPFGGGSSEEEELWTAETLGELDLKELGAEASTNWDLTPQDFIVKVRGKVSQDKTKEKLIAAILEAQGAEEEEGSGDAEDNSDDPF